MREQANLIVFAQAEREPGHSSGPLDSAIYGNLGRLSAHFSGLDATIPDDIGFTDDDYNYFKCQQSPSEAESVDYRESLLRAFEPFTEQVQAVRSALSKGEEPTSIPGYFASGNESYVFRVAGDPRRLLRVVHRDMVWKEVTEMYVSGTEKARGIDGLEQMVAASYELGSTVSWLVPGKSMENFTTDDVARIPGAHFSRLAKTTVDAAQRGVSLDGNDGNMLYDQDQGFGFVDFGAAASGENRSIVMAVTESLFKSGYWLENGIIQPAYYPEDFIVLRDALTDIIPTYERWLVALEQERVRSGLSDNYFTNMTQVRDRLKDMHTAKDTLCKPGAVDLLVNDSFEKRSKSIAAQQARYDADPPGHMKDHHGKMLEKTKAVPPKKFPNGKRWTSRNNTL